jgi:hypothetical protein
MPIRHRVWRVSTSRDRQQSFRTYHAPRIPHERRWGCGSRAAARSTTRGLPRAALKRSWLQDRHESRGPLRKGQNHDPDPVLRGRTTISGEVERTVPRRDRSQPERGRGVPRRARPPYAPSRTTCAGAARDPTASGGSHNVLGDAPRTISRICASISSKLAGLAR